MTADAHLELAGLVKSYGGRHAAVDGVSLTVEKGEFVTFLGPSGSGKTTTLMMIAGFEEPTRGDIRLDGQTLVAVAPWRRNVGMVFQNYALFPHMTVAQNVAFPLRMRGIARADQAAKVERALASVGLAGFAQRHPRELSGGQQQRVALARALVFEPDVLLLDEPLGALDRKLREHMQVEIKRLQRSLGITTLFVTHDQSEAMALSDRIAVFDKGRIEQVGSPLEVYHRPATEFVAGFVGDSNVFGITVREPGGLAVADAVGEIRVPATDRPAGSRLRLLVRPEAIVLLPHGDAAAGFNAFAATVEAVVHHGDSALVLARTADTTLRIRLAGRQSAGVRERDTLHVGWRAEDSCLLA